jgi:two-component system sensor histidine kinase KdpD
VQRDNTQSVVQAHQHPHPPLPDGAPVPRGHLKIYLGATPGAGKTFAMLREAHDLVRQGHDLVVGYVETYNRPRTVELLNGLDVVPRTAVAYKGATLQDMDVDAVLARNPEIALVDELAHTNAPGLRNEKRWQDVEALRDAGIDVISTVNVQHVESVKDLVEKVTGIVVRETVPDKELDGADVVQFIDIAPEALRKRMRHGNIYARDKVDTALANFFRPGNLAAMRQIGLRLVADSMARSRTVIDSPEDVLVAVSRGAATEDLMRRGARLARRRGGFCLVVTVLEQPGEDPRVAAYRELAVQLGCSFAVLSSGDPATAIIQAARDAGSDHVVVGETTRTSWLDRLRPTLVDRIIDGLPDADIHVIARVVQ